MQYRSLQDCRALAALMVVAFHASANLVKDKYLGELAQPLYAALWFGGDAGVAFFFVLSGFIVHHVHQGDLGQPARWSGYAIKRVVRVYPAFVLTYLAMTALVLLVPAWRDGLPSDIWVWLRGLALWPLDPRLVGGTGAPLVVVAWSLHYELLFYVLMGLGILHKGLMRVACVALAACVATQVWWPQDAFWLRFLGAHHLLLFALGVGASVAHSQNIQLRRPLAWAGAAALAFALTAWQASLHWMAYERMPFDLSYGLSSAVLIVALARRDVLRHQQGLPAAGLLPALWGDASYATYLIHFPIVAALSKLFTPLNNGTLAVAAITLVAMVGVCLAAGNQFHLRLEKPMMRGLRAWLQPATGPQGLRGQRA
jgi:exopolysaccharide production protein ExoZ